MVTLVASVIQNKTWIPLNKARCSHVCISTIVHWANFYSSFQLGLCGKPTQISPGMQIFLPLCYHCLQTVSKLLTTVCGTLRAFICFPLLQFHMWTLRCSQISQAVLPRHAVSCLCGFHRYCFLYQNTTPILTSLASFLIKKIF